MKHAFQVAYFAALLLVVGGFSFSASAQNLQPIEGREPLGVGHVKKGYCVPVLTKSETVVYKPAAQNRQGKYRDLRKQLKKLKKQARVNPSLQARVKKLRQRVRSTNELCQFYTKEPPGREGGLLPGGAGQGSGNGITPNGQLIASLFEIPDLIGAVQSKAVLAPAAVSGVPVSADGIRTLGVEKIFWESGALNALDAPSPTVSECQEFIGMGADGSSGGLTSCYLIEDVIYPMELFLETQRYGCYLRNAPSRNALKSGAISIIGGSLPSKDIEGLFEAIANSFTLRAEIIHPVRGKLVAYVRTHSASERKESGNIYAADLWGCGDGKATAESFTLLEVDYDGILSIATEHNTEEGVSSALFAALLKGDPEVGIDFDIEQPRVLSLSHRSSDSSRSFKSHLVFGGESEIVSKMNTVGSIHRQSYGVHRYTAKDILSYRVFEGAGQYRYLNQDRSELDIGLFGSEFRKLLYVSAPDNDYIGKVQDYVLSDDSFFQEVPSFESDFPEKSCTAPSDLSIRIDLNNVDLDDAVRYPCDVDIPQDTDFCSDTEVVAEGEAHYLSKCVGE